MRELVDHPIRRCHLVYSLQKKTWFIRFPGIISCCTELHITFSIPYQISFHLSFWINSKVISFELCSNFRNLNNLHRVTDKKIMQRIKKVILMLGFRTENDNHKFCLRAFMTFSVTCTNMKTTYLVAVLSNKLQMWLVLQKNCDIILSIKSMAFPVDII